MISVSSVVVEIHADDYGQTVNTSNDILTLMKGGHLDGISILPNMTSADECMEKLKKEIPSLPFLPLMSVHLDLVEGHMLSRHGELIPWTWKKLFLASYHLGPADTFDVLKKEISAQIKKAQAHIEECQHIAFESGIPYTPQKLRIDSHQHAHMLPIVWKALMQVIDEERLEVEYIRNSHELMGPFAKTMAGSHYRPVNILKNRILAFYAPKVEKYIENRGLKPMYLWGLIMSGHMDMERIKKVMPEMISRCSRAGVSLELNIHPGLMLAEEMCDEVPEASARDFYLTDDRKTEYKTVSVIHEYLKGLQIK